MIIDHLVVGDYETNCYVIRKESGARQCLIIDVGMDPDAVISYLEKIKSLPEAVVFTHGHADHIAGLSAVREKYPDMKTVIHKKDAEMITDPEKNLSMLAGGEFWTYPAEIQIFHQEEISFADVSFSVFRTPGHTPGGMCLYNSTEKALFCGDTLFAGSIGRTDFPGGSHDQLINSIKEHILTLPDDTKVLPGHGPSTTIGQEKAVNPYLS